MSHDLPGRIRPHRNQSVLSPWPLVPLQVAEHLVNMRLSLSRIVSSIEIALFRVSQMLVLVYILFCFSVMSLFNLFVCFFAGSPLLSPFHPFLFP
jgi:hypothetical protein